MPSNNTLIFLIGLMGSGKSTFGRALARTLAYDYIDLDTYIEQQVDMSIADYFSIHGEPDFRQLETNTLRRLGKLQKTVVATGGGTPCHSGNMLWMNTHGVTVYLQMTPAAILSRLSQSEQSKRPLLQGKTPAEMLTFIEQTLVKRVPYYQQAAHTVDGLHVKVGELVKALKV